MIIDFSVRNFRSIQDEQFLSLHAEQRGTHLTKNLISSPDEKFDILPCAGIYGANASGKSNILKALKNLISVITETGDLKEDEEIPFYEPFKLDPESQSAPTEFSIEFFGPDRKRYKYRVSYNQSAILEEKLDVYPSRQPANIFTRTEENTWENIKFGNHYRGKSRRIPLFKNNSYLSKAGNNASSADFIRGIYKQFRSILSLEPGSQYFLINYFKQKEKLDMVANFLCAVDTGISSISREKNSGNFPTDFPPLAAFPDHIRKKVSEDFEHSFKFWHESRDGEKIPFDEELESAGTRNLFNMLPLMIEALRAGHTLLIDELDSSLHPHIAKLIIRLFNDPTANKKDAQLIFTTHDMSLMSSKALRRDQLWFVTKKFGSTHLHSLDEYEKNVVKPNSPFDTWYDQGRFGAVPRTNYEKIKQAISEKE